MRFLRGQTSWSWSIMRNSDRQSFLSSRAIFDSFIWLRVFRLLSCCSILWFCEYRLMLSGTFIPSNVTSLVNYFQQFLDTIYVPFIFWIIINNYCSTVLIFSPTMFNNCFLFVWEYNIASKWRVKLNFKKNADFS